MTESEAVALIEGHLAQGQYFWAYDAYRTAQAEGVQSLQMTLLGALSLLRCGAVQEARRLLRPLGQRLESRQLRRERRAQAFRLAVLEALRAGPHADADASMAAVDRFLQDFESASGTASALVQADAPDTLRLMGQVLQEVWAATGDAADLAQAARLIQQAHALTGQPDDGLAAARLEALAGRTDAAIRLASTLMGQCDGLELRAAQATAVGSAATWARLGAQLELAVLQQDADAVDVALQALQRQPMRHLPTVVELLRRLQVLGRSGWPVLPQIGVRLHPPVVVAFAGPPLDDPNSLQPSFPAALEPQMARCIAQELDRLGAEVGFCCASAGAELLFVEAMLDRGAEVHITLPFRLEDFIAYRVAPAGGHWERRFRNACKLATSVSYATEEAYLGHDALLRFNHRLIHGTVRSYAQSHMARPWLLAVWDYAAEGGAGSTAEFIDHWTDAERLRLIDLDEWRDDAQAIPAQGPAAQALLTRQTSPGSQALALCAPAVVGPARVIRTMLFADLVGYSKLQEADLPLLWQQLAAIKPLLEPAGDALRLVESWGDAVYAVMDNSLDMAAYAFALIEAVSGLDAEAAGLSRGLQLRVGLHAGPVYEGVHPLTGRPIVYGSHVSRAARIEPVSLPGHVYASQQFVALLLAEESAAAHAAQALRQDYHARYACEYLGQLSLAKNYGRQQVFHVRRLDPV